MAGEVEIRVTVGDTIYSGQMIAVVEGDNELESLSVRKPSVIEEIFVQTGVEVEAGTLLMSVLELEE